MRISQNIQLGKSFEISLLDLADFDGDGVADNISFMIKRIKVHPKDAVQKDPTYRFPGNYGVEKFLEIFSGESERTDRYGHEREARRRLLLRRI